MEGAPRRPPPSSPPAGGVKSADGARSGVQLMGKALLGLPLTLRGRVRVRGRGRGRVRGKALLGTDRPLTLPLLLPLRRCLVPIDP